MIEAPYLIVLNVRLCRHQGLLWGDPLWIRDLDEHCRHIGQLLLACPVENRAPPEGWRLLPAGVKEVCALPPMRRFSALTSPLVVPPLWRIMKRSAVVHTGVAGWPYPLGWIAVLLATLQRRFVVIVVESAFWRISPSARVSTVSRLRARLFEAINRACLARADLSFFTTDDYRRSLGSKKRQTHVMPAVWIDAADVIDAEALTAAWERKKPRLLFAGRLTADKGVKVLLAAARDGGIPVDVIGSGNLSDIVAAEANKYPDAIKLLPPIDYGPAFSSLLDNYQGLVVPTITDEQPRVIFDAFARGIPVLASNTTGNRQLVKDEHNGLLFEADDVSSLKRILRFAADRPDDLRRMGENAAAEAATRTHASMHSDRAQMIAQAMAQKRR